MFSRAGVCLIYRSHLGWQHGWYVFNGIPKDTVPKATCVSANWMTSKLQCPLSSQGVWETTLSKTSIFAAPKISQIFLLFAAWPWATAPEARHRCTSQPGTPMIRLSRGSSRPRLPWMWRTQTAVASDEGSGCKRPWGIGWLEEVDAMLMVQVFSLCWKVSAKTFAHLCTNILFFGPVYVFCTSLFTILLTSFDHFSLAVVWFPALFNGPWHPDFYQPPELLVILA